MRRSQSLTFFVTLIALAISLVGGTARAQFNYCAASCAAFEYPSTWTGCIYAPCGNLCSPVAAEVVVPCGNFPHSISAAHKAICDAAWCQAMQGNFDSYVGCVETHMYGVPEYPECCYGQRMILCAEINACLADFNLFNALANAQWALCMGDWTSMLDDPSLEELVTAYLA